MKARALLLLVLGFGLAGPARGQDLGDLSGSVDVSHVQAEVDGRDDETWRQIYTLNWTKQATDYIDMRAALRYYDFDLDSADQAFGTFQEEIQPSAELAWNHPWFRFTANGSRRVSRSPAIADKLINNSLLLNWQSAWMDTPILGVRYEHTDVRETGTGATRDVRDRRLIASVDYEREHESFDYRFTRSWTDNVIRGLKSTENQQRFRYLGSYRFGTSRQYQLATQYRYNRSDRNSEVGTGQRFLEKVEPTAGLAEIDPTPEQGPLAVVPGLIDGNTLAPVAPPVSIGAGDLDRNVGVDLGVRRDRIAAVYVYTDRLSAATVQWRVWVSDDNLNWDTSPVLFLDVRFNPTLSRYEIEFNELRARYVKVVNGGVNSVVDVQVTEVEVFESLPVTEEVERDASSHLADARLVWNLNPRWQATVDGLVRLDPPSGTLGQQLDYSYGLRARYQPHVGLAHIWRWSQAWREFEDETRNIRDDTAGYTFQYDPLPTVGTTVSASFRQSFEDQQLSLRSASGLFGVSALPLRTIRTSAEFGVSRVDQPSVGYLTDTWNTRWSLDTEITRQLRALVTWLHQESRDDGSDGIRVQRRVSFTGELQVTSAIFGRASVSLSDDRNFYRTQDYLLSWRLFDRLLLTGQARLDEGSAGYDTRRYSVNGYLDLFDRFLLFRNVTVYLQFSDLDQSEGGGSHIVSWQQGLRAAF